MSITGKDTLGTRKTLDVNGKSYDYFSLEAAEKAGVGDVSRLPYSLKVVLENLLRREDGRTVTVDDVKALGAWLENADTRDTKSPTFLARVLDAGLHRRSRRCRSWQPCATPWSDGRRPGKINPLAPVDLVIDHSVMIDESARPTRSIATLSWSLSATWSAIEFSEMGPASLFKLPRCAARAPASATR